MKFLQNLKSEVILGVKLYFSPLVWVLYLICESLAWVCCELAFRSGFFSFLYSPGCWLYDKSMNFGLACGSIVKNPDESPNAPKYVRKKKYYVES